MHCPMNQYMNYIMQCVFQIALYFICFNKSEIPQFIITAHIKCTEASVVVQVKQIFSTMLLLAHNCFQIKLDSTTLLHQTRVSRASSHSLVTQLLQARLTTSEHAVNFNEKLKKDQVLQHMSDQEGSQAKFPCSVQPLRVTDTVYVNSRCIFHY